MATDDNAPSGFVPLDETPPSGVKPLDETPPSGTPSPTGGAPAGFQPPPSSRPAPSGFQPTQPAAAGKPPSMPRPGEVKFSCPCGKRILAPPGVVVMCPKCRKIQRAPGKLQAAGRPSAPATGRPTVPTVKRDRSGLVVALVGILSIAGVIAFLGYKITNDIAKRKDTPAVTGGGGQVAAQPANGKETVGATIAILKVKADELRQGKQFPEAKAAYVAALTAMDLLADKNHPLRKVILDALKSDDIKYGADPASTHVLFGGKWITRAQYEALKSKGIKPASPPPQTAAVPPAASKPDAKTPEPAATAPPKQTPKPMPAAQTIMPLKPTEANLLRHGRIIASDPGGFTPHNVKPGSISKLMVSLEPHFENWARAPGSIVTDAKGLGKLPLNLDHIQLSTPEGMAGTFTRADKDADETTLASPFILNLAVAKRCEARTYALDFKVPVQTDASAKVNIEVSFSVVVQGDASQDADDPEAAAPTKPARRRPIVRRLIVPGVGH